MNRFPRSLANALSALSAAILLYAGPGCIADVIAQAEPVKQETVRPAIATLLQAAQELIKAKSYTDALVKIREAEGVADRTPYENFAIDQTRAAAAAGAGDAALTLKSLEALVASGRLTPTEQLRMMETIANVHYRSQNYPKAVEWGSRYFKEGGTDAQMRALLTRSLYLSDDFANAASMLRADIEADEKAGRTPAQERVQMLASCYAKLNDNAGYVYTLEKMLAYYPKREYWADAIRRVESAPGFSDRLSLDLARLRQATGNLTTAAQYAVMMQLALEAGLPAEAKKAADQGFTSGVLGSGADASQHRKLQEMAAKQVAEDEKTLAQSVKDAGSARDGTALVNVGFTLVSAGQYDKGIALMEQGLQKGGLKRPDDARLHLGIAYLRAGQKAKAVEMFKLVQGADGTAALARLWAIHAQGPAG